MFSGKTVIVTGSSRGIGKAIAAEFATLNANVILSGRNIESLNIVKNEFSAGDRIHAIAGDVSLMADAQKLIRETAEKFGRIDILINNAGITRDNLLLRMSENDWDEVIQVNLKGTFNCIKAATKTLIKQKSGNIINITSVVGQTGNAGQANYAASKAGIIGLTKSVAKELAGRNIRVNAIAPGFIETDMTDNLSSNVKDDLLKSIPLGKLGDVKDVAQAVVFLASENARYITGQIINVDGGMVV